MSALPIDRLINNVPVAAAPDPATALCLACGLCCDGTLHNHALLQPDELEHARKVGLGIIDDGTTRLSFKLPCPQFHGCCSIFGERPRVCAGYQCSLLKNFNKGSVSLDGALEKVIVARGLADALRNAVPEAQSIFDARADAAQSLGNEASSAQSGDTKVRAIALHLFLNKHFLDGKSTWLEVE